MYNISMKKLDRETKFAHLGKPGSIFSQGFERRLQKILKVADFKDKKILDQGSGEGVWLFRFNDFTKASDIYGQDIDPEAKAHFLSRKAQIDSKIPDANYKICPAEKLDFANEFFDIVFSNEVLEHVENDVLAVSEAYRVLKKGGLFVIFTPNRGWPFETHGMFFRGKYYWGNIPLLPWMPKFVRQKFSPHVRNYSNKDIRKLFGKDTKQDAKKAKTTEYSWQVIKHKHVFPGFDGAARRFGVFGKLLQKVFFMLEKTPLHFFGISHFVVVRKV